MRTFLSLFLLLVNSVFAFVPQKTFPKTPAPSFRTSTQLEVAPTMVVYWSIKTAIDGVNYALGNKDEWKGTGVFSGIQVKREKSDDDDETASNKKPEPEKATATKSK